MIGENETTISTRIYRLAKLMEYSL
jgi:hypothetical protein